MRSEWLKSPIGFAGRYVRGVTLAGVAMLMAGCAQYVANPIVPSETALSLDSRSLNDPRLLAFVEKLSPRRVSSRGAVKSWGLADLTYAALYYHPNIEVAQSKFAVAQAAIVTAGQIPNPTLRFTPTYHSVITVPSPWTVGTAIDFLIETAGRRPIRIAQSESLAEAARLDVETASWQVRGHVRSALLKLWSAQNRLTLVRRRQSLQEQLAGILEQGFSAGQISALDIARERTNLNQMRLAGAEGIRQVAEARAELATAIGVPLRALHATNFAFSAFTQTRTIPGNARSLRGYALRNRSDIKGMLATYEASQSALQLEVARQFPNITLGPGFEYDQGDDLYSLAVGFDLPIFNQNQGPIAEALARRQESAARFKALQAQVLGEIDRSFAIYRATTQALAQADVLVAEQRKRQQDVKRAFDAGEVDRTALALADIELSTIELSRLESVIQQRQAIESLEDALQRQFLESSSRPFSGSL